MRFKKLLKESEREEALEKLHEKLNTGKWIFRKPWIYRGTKSDESIKVKDVSSRKNRTPKDTDDFVDKLLHIIYEHCYSDYPKRQESIFATTSTGGAAFFGDLFVIFPSKKAKISSRGGDPHDLFTNLEVKINEIRNLWESNSDEIVKYIKSLPKEEERKIYSITSFLSGLDMRFDHNDIPCPEHLDHYVDDFVTKHGNGLRTEPEGVQDLIHKSDHAALLLKKYFSNIDLNYPDQGDYAGEVMIDGEYLQVEKELFDDYYKNYL